MRVSEARQRLARYLDMVPPETRDLYGPLLDELAFQEAKLSETRAALAHEPVAVEGDRMPHRNAMFDGYNALFDRYLKGLRALSDAIQPAAGGPDDPGGPRPKRTLASFRRKTGS